MVTFYNDRAKSYPVIYHAPGMARQFPQWLRLVDTMHGKPAGLSDELSLITWCDNPEITMVGRSLAKWGCKPAVLGQHLGSHWANTHKIRLTVEYLQNCKTPYVMGLDAFDVILTAHPHEALRRFKLLGSKLMYNASLRRWPARTKVLHDCDVFEQSLPGPYRHLNAGCWIAETDYALNFYANVLATLDTKAGEFPERIRLNEQPYVKYCAFPGSSPAVSVDTGCHIFQHMAGASHLVEIPEGPCGETYIDLGANIGKTALSWLLSNPDTIVHAFEPQKSCLTSSSWDKAREVGGDRLTIHPVAVGTIDAETTLRAEADKPHGQSATTCATKVYPQANLTERVPQIDFVKWLQDLKPEGFVTLKIDIEGAEYAILRKAMDSNALLAVHQIFIEWHSSKLSNRPEILPIEEELRAYCHKHGICLVEYVH